MFSVQQLLDNWIQSLQKTAVLHLCVVGGWWGGAGGNNENVATNCLPGLSLHQAFNPSRDPGCSSGLLHVGPPTAQGQARRGSWCGEGPCGAAPPPRPQTPCPHLSASLSCAYVGVIPLDAVSPALQQAGQLTQVSGGVLNGGLLLPLEEPSGTQGEPETVPAVNRSTQGPLGRRGRRTFCLFVGMQELSVWHLPGKAAPAFLHLLPSPLPKDGAQAPFSS